MQPIMEIRITNPMNLFCFTAETTLVELMQYVRVKPHELYCAAANAGLEVVGPQYWIYSGSNGNPGTRFTLQIGIPVHDADGRVADFATVACPAIECAVMVHEGTWAELPATYGKLIAEVIASGRSLSGVTREVYLHIDFDNPANCRTEIQLGLLPK